MICLYSYIGSARSNEVINFVTRIRNHYDEPRLIKCENDEETILVAINDFIVEGIYMCMCAYVHISLRIADFIVCTYENSIVSQ